MSETLSQETKNLIYTYLDASCNLYGLIPIKKIFSIYNSQNEPVSEEDFAEVISDIDFDNVFYRVIGYEDIYEDVEETRVMDKVLVAEHIIMDGFEDYFYMRKMQIGTEYYVPEKKQLLKYADQYYFEKTPEFISMRAFFRNMPDVDREKADSIAEDIMLVMSMEINPYQPCFYEAYVRNLKFNQQQENELKMLLYELNRKVRKNYYCGHNLDEIEQM